MKNSDKVAIKSFSKLFGISIVIGGLYFLLLLAIEYMLASRLPLEFFETEADIQKVYLFEYLVVLLIVGVIYTFNRDFLSFNSQLNSKKIKYLLPFFLALIVQILNNPIHQYDSIMGNKEVINEINYFQVKYLPLILFFKSVILVPIVEEVVFRGYILGRFVKEQKYIFFGLILSTILFALIHISLKSMFAALVIGLVAGCIYLKIGLIGAIIFHSFYNFIWYLSTINSKAFWNIHLLDFGVIYWVIVVIAATLVLLYLRNTFLSLKNSSSKN